MLKDSKIKFKKPELVTVCGTCGKAVTGISSLDSGTLTGRYLREHICLCHVSLVESMAPGGGKQTAAWRRHSAMLSRSSYFSLGAASTFDGQTYGGGEGARFSFEPGTIIGGVYEVISTLGWGGMGTVYKVKHKVLERISAVKVLDSRLADANAWKRFQIEARSVASLNHRALVNVYDLGLHEGKTPFFVMDFVEGVSLEALLLEGGPLFLEDVLRIFDVVLDCLAYTHKAGIIHRDIKPANIMVSVDTLGNTTVKLLDFGLAKLSVEALTGMDLDKKATLPVSEDKEKEDKIERADSSRTPAHMHQFLTSHDEVFGSPHYMSPEQCQGGVVDARSDIYSAGCSIFEALTGEVPFEGRNALETMLMHQEDTPPALQEKSKHLSKQQVLPDVLEQIVARCLCKDPRQRYQNVAALKSDLASIKDGHRLRDLVNFSGSAEQENVSDTLSAKKKTVLLELPIPDWNSYGIAGQLLLLSLAIATCLTLFFIGYWSVLAISGQIESQQKSLRLDRQHSLLYSGARQEIGTRGIIEIVSGAIANDTNNVNDLPDGGLYADPAFASPGEYGLVIVRPDDGVVSTSSYLHFIPPELCDFSKRVDVILRPGPAIIAFPEKILKMKGNQLTALDLGSLPADNSGADSHFEKSFPAMVNVLNKLPNIQSLRISSTADKALLAKELKRLKYIRSLDLSGTSLPVDDLIGLPYFSKLESLEIGPIVDFSQMTKLIKELKHCKKLSRLTLSNCVMKDIDLKKISPFSQIHTLALTGCTILSSTIGEADLEKYARFPGVRSLFLEDMQLSEEETRKVITVNPQLQRLTIIALDPSLNASQARLLQLKTYLNEQANLRSVFVSNRDRDYTGAFDRYTDHLRLPGQYQEIDDSSTEADSLTRDEQ